MKKLITALFALTTVALYAQNHTGVTDLNSTPAQLIARYGKPASVEPAWYGAGKSYSFQDSRSGYFIFATTEPTGGRVEDVQYLRKGSSLTRAEKAHLLLVNSDTHIAYYGDRREFGVDVDWDGNEAYRGFRKEHQEIFVKSDLNWTHQIINNETDDGGFQVRTKAQFEREQKALAAR
jgi:hypothetical protein